MKRRITGYTRTSNRYTRALLANKRCELYTYRDSLNNLLYFLHNTKHKAWQEQARAMSELF